MSPTQIRKLLVANRGEIAVRIFRAADELDLRTVAIYTYEDRYSLHRFKADEAYQIGTETDPLKPYLDIEEIIEVALRNGVDAIHPGYGFLSENTQFARRCREAGIIFVGPSPEVMERLGDKISAKKVAQEVGVPLIQSNKQPLENIEVALEEAKALGFPVILKATAGGGGRGMRVVRNEEELEQAYTEARREAGRAFGSDIIFMEQYVGSPKHIEVQLLGDHHGNIVHLFERDCSVQRRFQKVVEVAPSSGMKQETLNKLYEYSLRVARHVGLNNASTAEYLVDANENVFFIEVNPRIQVEHTVTEEITGIDLVRSQILIASGVDLFDPEMQIGSQSDIQKTGFAIQCRITTEDPANNFQPDYGTVIAYRSASGFGIRLDEGNTYTGVQISPFFDSMLVKVTAKGRTLSGAAIRLGRTLREFRIRGVKTNIPFLQNVIKHPTFLAGDATVTFIGNNPDLFEFTPRQDRGTKALCFISEVTVNGNPDVKRVDPDVLLRPAEVPDFPRFNTYPSGTKQKLLQLGREDFVQWLKDEPRIQYTDTTFRDAHQSLLATRVRTIDMVRVAESFAKNHSEVFSMEVWGGATFDVAMRFLHEDPWQRLRLFRQAMPNILLQMLIRGANAVGYTAYPDNLVVRFIEESAKEGIDIFRIFDSLNWVENMKVSIRAVRERTQSLAEAAICYTGDILDPNEHKYTLQYYLDMARQLEDEGTHILAIKDMAGLLKPYAAEVLITELKKAVDLPIHLHTHDTSSLQVATYLKAIEAGVDIVDVALSSMSELTSQPNFNSLVAMMEMTPPHLREKRHLPIDLPKLNQFSNYWEAVREWYYPFESGLKAGTAEIFDHEIPGGQYSNLRPQARALGLEDKFETIKANYVAVNELFGDIVKVTPSSKVVGDMALYMTSNGLSSADVLEKGDTISFPDSVRQLFRGELGHPPGGFPKELQEMVLKGEKPFTGRANEHLKPVDFEKDFEQFQEKFPETSFLDFLSYSFYPKVFEEYYRYREDFGDVMGISTPVFFYGMKPGEEILFDVDKGKTIIIKLLYISQPDAEGMRTVGFELNGIGRRLRVRDKSIHVKEQQHEKADTGKPGQVAASLQGKLSSVLVKEGDKVEKKQPLFIIEAMKMESTITSPINGKVKRVVLQGGVMVEGNDLVVEVEA